MQCLKSSTMAKTIRLSSKLRLRISLKRKNRSIKGTNTFDIYLFIEFPECWNLASISDINILYLGLCFTYLVERQSFLCKINDFKRTFSEIHLISAHQTSVLCLFHKEVLPHHLYYLKFKLIWNHFALWLSFSIISIFFPLTPSTIRL